jgi:hypothetical protein
MAYDPIKKAEYQKAYKIKNRTRLLEYKRKWKANNYELTMYDNAKHRARRKGLEFTIDMSDLIIPEMCPILEIPIKMNVGGVQHDSPSLDRIDNNRGYIKGNIMIISNLANVMKSYASAYQLIKFAKWVLKTYNEEQALKELDRAINFIEDEEEKRIKPSKNPNQMELF